MQNDLNVLTISGVVSVNHNISGSIGISSGGGAGNDDAILSGTWAKTSYSNSNITKLSPDLPDNVEFPNVTEIGEYACSHRFGGKNYSFPKCTTVSAYAFNANTDLVSISLPLCVSVGANAFSSCTHLSTISLPKCETITNYAFSAAGLQSIDLPEVTSIGGDAFRNNGSLKTLYLPKCTEIGSQAFVGTGLTTVDLPAIVTINGSVFNNIKTLTTVTFGENIADIKVSTFMGCTALTSVTIKATTPPTLGMNVFTNTPIAGSGAGKIYVPASVVDTYKAASGWSTYASHIEAIPSE